DGIRGFHVTGVQTCALPISFEDGYMETPLRIIAWKRGVWLVFLSIMALVTAEVMDRFGSSSEMQVTMFSFLPLVLASGGNTGSQLARASCREMSAMIAFEGF